MSTRARQRKFATNPNGLPEEVFNDSDRPDEDDSYFCFLKSSKSSSQRKMQPQHANRGRNPYDSTTNRRQEHTSEWQARDPNQKGFVPTIKSSGNSELSRDRQSKIKDETYMEPDPIKVAKDGVEDGYKELSDHEGIKTNHGQRSDFQKDGNKNVSHGGTQPDLTENKGKGNNGTHGGTGLDHTKKTMTSTFDQSVPSPRKEKEKAISSTFEQTSPLQKKETEKAISSHGQRSDFQKDGNKNVSRGDTHPNLTKNKGKGNNGTHGGTGLDHTKKTKTSTFDQSVPSPKEEKEKANSSSFEQAPPMKEKKKAFYFKNLEKSFEATLKAST